jgi:4-amino-4-deoxy-L-arabinose transferase-like glycosyltransferase
MKKKIIWLVFILALLVRFINLSNLPPALNRDEAAIGLNAYSILETDQDEHGQFMPLAFKSIGDYKMPLYIYATTIPVKLFGLNDFSIRFWSALAGAVSVLSLFYLVFALTKKRSVALTASILLTLNPWAIFYSRIGFEANLALAFFLTGLALVLYGFRSFWRFNLGLGVLTLAFLTYSSSLIFIPLFLSIFFFVNRNKIDKKRILSLVIFILLFSFIFKSLWSISAQKANITVFSDPTIINTYNQTRTEIIETNPILARTWWNKYVYFARLVTTNYFKSFSPKFLLTVGGNHPWHRVPSLGNFYLPEIFLAILGLWWLVKRKDKKLSWILLSWLLLAPLASAITIDAPHSTRSLHLLPIILIFSALGSQHIYQIYQKGQSLLVKKIIILLTVVYLINLVYATYQYTYIYPKNFPDSIPLGLKELIINHDLTGNIFIHGIHSSNYLYPAIYQYTPPTKFHKQAVWTLPDLTNLSNVYQFDNITIVDQPKDLIDPDFVIWPTSENLNLLNLRLIDQSGFYSLYQTD